IVPGSTLRYGSSFCITTRSPRAVSRLPRLEAVRPLPSEDATPPVTKMCLVVRAVGANACSRVVCRGRADRRADQQSDQAIHGIPRYHLVAVAPGPHPAGHLRATRR